MTSLPGYPCTVCNRQSGPITIHMDDHLHRFCGQDCARIFMTRPTITKDENQACKIGGDAAGAFLERIGKTDLASLSLTEWEEFCATLYTAVCDELRRKADDDIPF